MLEPKLKAKQWDLKFEEDLLEQWAREPDLYACDPSRGPLYVIDTPPPYPSGEWHPGAVIGYSLIEIVARAQRMLGKAVLFPFGLDRNGINIERTVEEKYGKLLHEWDRGEFIEKCREEISHIGEGILVIAKRMGMTMDFANTYHTDADDYRAYSQAIFIDLFHRGLFYRGERPSFYCVYCETPLAEADIVYESKASVLAWIRFPLDGGGAVMIATTRPELLAACRTVIIHPDDERWRTAVGKTARVPIFQQGVPVRTHPEAKVDFGSGAAMICSYGDMVDVRLFREFQLEPVKAIDERGRMTDAAGRYAGMEVERAREAVLADLKSAGFLEKLEQVEHQTPLCERSRTPVEFLVSEAWYLKQLEFRERLRTLGNEVGFPPPPQRELLLDWIDTLTIDWPISRRRYYHTEIPLWYCKTCGHILAPPPGKYYRPWRDPAPFEACTKCGGREVVGEDSVFDTWMDSSNSNLWVTRYRKDDAFFGASETGPGDDFRISEDRIGGAQKFITKLWNVSRFVSSFPVLEAGRLKPSDEWILAELNRLIGECRGAYEAYSLFTPANRCREFLWNVFAPHYLEMVKARAYAGDDGAMYTLHAVLRDLLRLLAPIIPFSTDRIWREMYGGSVHTEMLPHERDGIRGELVRLTAEIEAFNSEGWRGKGGRGGGI